MFHVFEECVILIFCLLFRELVRFQKIMTSKICRKYFSCATSCVQRCKNTCRLLGETWNTRKITFLNFLSGQSHPSLVNQFCGLMHISSLFSSFLSSFLSSFCPSPPLLYSFPCLFLPFFLSFFLSSGYFSFFDFFSLVLFFLQEVVLVMNCWHPEMYIFHVVQTGSVLFLCTCLGNCKHGYNSFKNVS